MDEQQPREEHLFIVRTWREPSASDRDWRVSVLHVPSGLRLASSHLRDVDDFIRLRLEPAANGTPHKAARDSE